MTPSPSAGKSDWIVGIRVWIERAGRAILGKGRVELLEGIDRCHSISEAARQMGMSYRRAWLLVQSINAGAGEPLVEAAVGGIQGGGARLTDLGRQAVALFRELQEHLQTSAAALQPRLAFPVTTAPAVHIAAAVSLEEVLGQLLADFALRQPGVSVRTVFGASDELADHILAGTAVDLFLSADVRQVDRLAAAGLVESNGRSVLAGNRLAMIGPADAPFPVRRVNDLLRPEVERVALAKSGTPLGNYSLAYLKEAGLHDALLPRLFRVDSSRSVVAAVQAGRAEVGLAYASDATRAAGCRVLLRVRQAPLPIHFIGCLLRCGQQGSAARVLLDYLASPAARHCFRRWGFLPAR
jgi:molybdenum ABC transporter molybdate-binding protein